MNVDRLDRFSLKLIEKVAEMPFAEHGELARCTGQRPRRVQRTLNSLMSNMLVGYVPHAGLGSARSRRWYLTDKGMAALSWHRDCTWESLSQHLPISLEWQRSLLRRLDSILPFYRVVSEVSNGEGREASWRWFRVGAADGLMETGSGKLFALMRFGPTLSWRAMRSRLGSMYNGQRNGRWPDALLVVQGQIEIQRIAREMSGRATSLYLAVEDDLVQASSGAAVWRSHRNANGLTTMELVKKAGLQPVWPQSLARKRQPESMPSSRLEGRVATSDLASTQMTVQEKRMMKVLFDWPLMRMEEVSRMLGLSVKSLIKPTARLADKGMLFHIRIGATPDARHENGTRLCLSENGMRYLGRLDRRRLSELVNHWGIYEDDAGSPEYDIGRYRLVGTKLRVLADEFRVC